MSKKTLGLCLALALGVSIYVHASATNTTSATWEDIQPFATVDGPTNYGSGCHRVCKDVGKLYTCLENIHWETYCVLAGDETACITLPNCSSPCEYPCN